MTPIDILCPLQEAYDNETKFSMYTFKDTVAQLTGMNQYTELNDFNTGKK